MILVVAENEAKFISLLNSHPYFNINNPLVMPQLYSPNTRVKIKGVEYVMFTWDMELTIGDYDKVIFSTKYIRGYPPISRNIVEDVYQLVSKYTKGKFPLSDYTLMDFMKWKDKYVVEINHPESDEYKLEVFGGLGT